MERLRLRHQRYLLSRRQQALEKRSARTHALLTAGLGSWFMLAVAAILTGIASHADTLSGSWKGLETAILCTTFAIDLIALYALSFCESYLQTNPYLPF